MPIERYTPGAELAANARASLRPRWIALAGTGAGAALAWGTGALVGRSAVLTTAPLALCGGLVGMLLAELAAPGSSAGTVRRAMLERRSAARVAGRGWLWGWRVALAVAVAVILLAGLVGAADGRSLTIDCPGRGEGSLGPWPGWAYGLPLLGVLLVGAFVAELALARGVHRRAILLATTDEQLRAASINTVVRLGLTLALLTFAEVTLGAFAELGNACATSPPSWVVVGAPVLGIVGAAAAVAAVATFGSIWRGRNSTWN